MADVLGYFDEGWPVVFLDLARGELLLGLEFFGVLQDVREGHLNALEAGFGDGFELLVESVPGEDRGYCCQVKVLGLGYSWWMET